MCVNARAPLARCGSAGGIGRGCRASPAPGQATAQPPAGLTRRGARCGMRLPSGAVRHRTRRDSVVGRPAVAAGRRGLPGSRRPPVIRQPRWTLAAAAWVALAGLTGAACKRCPVLAQPDPRSAGVLGVAGVPDGTKLPPHPPPCGGPGRGLRIFPNVPGTCSFIFFPPPETFNLYIYLWHEPFTDGCVPPLRWAIRFSFFVVVFHLCVCLFFASSHEFRITQSTAIKQNELVVNEGTALRVANAGKPLPSHTLGPPPVMIAARTRTHAHHA